MPIPFSIKIGALEHHYRSCVERILGGVHGLHKNRVLCVQNKRRLL